MPTTPVLAGGSFAVGFLARNSARARRWFTPLSAALAVMITVAWARPAAADPLFVTIGSVANFQAGPVGGGPWRLGDKDWTYLDSKNWTGIEQITLEVNSDPTILTHQFRIDKLSGYTKLMPMPLVLDYKVSINELGGHMHFYDVFLGSIVSGKTVTVTKDLFASEADYTSNTIGWQLTALNGVPDSTPLPNGLTELWVRDTILLSGRGGQVSSVNNTFRQTAVPEIDPNSFASALAMALGGLSLLGHRARRAGRASTAV